MADAPRKSSPWPLLAILVLGALLATFLVLQWRKRDAERITYKPPPPVHPPPAPPDPASAEFHQQVALARKAIEAGKWDEAEAAIEAARKAKDAPELAALKETVARKRKEEETARAEELGRQAARRKQEEGFAAIKGKVEKDRTESRWDGALASLEEFAKEFPPVLQDAEYDRLLDRFRRLREDADGAFAGLMAEARKLAGAEKYGPALTQAEKALGFYPEREPAVKKFRDEIQEARLLKEMVRIPSATCWIGSAAPDEGGLRQVTLPPFYLDRTEVTNEDYMAFVAATGHPAPPQWGQARKPPPKRERHPVVQVTFSDASKYAAWIGKRLPSAEEWEVAARGPDQREFPWGNAFTEKDNVYLANSLEYWQYNKSLNPGTTPVDQETFSGPNSESAFRVLGMGGNVWEWTSTAVPRGPGVEFRVLKGGSFMTSKTALRCSNVYLENPAFGHPDVGFRCARDPK